MSEPNAGETTARTRLDTEREAMARARAALADAERDLDAAAIAAAKSMVGAHQYVIDKLEGPATAEAEHERESRAKPLAKSLQRDVSAVAEKVAALQAERAAIMKQYCESIEREAAVREAVQASTLGLELLAARFPALKIREPGDDVPPFVDSAGPVVRAEDKLLRLRRRAVYFGPMRRAGDTEEQRRWFDLAELRKLVAKHPEFIPSDVLTVIQPLPDAGERPTEVPPPSLVAQTERALSGTRRTIEPAQR